MSEVNLDSLLGTVVLKDYLFDYVSGILETPEQEKLFILLGAKGYGKTIQLQELSKSFEDNLSDTMAISYFDFERLDPYLYQSATPVIFDALLAIVKRSWRQGSNGLSLDEDKSFSEISFRDCFNPVKVVIIDNLDEVLLSMQKEQAIFFLKELLLFCKRDSKSMIISFRADTLSCLFDVDGLTPDLLMSTVMPFTKRYPLTTGSSLLHFSAHVDV